MRSYFSALDDASSCDAATTTANSKETETTRDRARGGETADRTTARARESDGDGDVPRIERTRIESNRRIIF